MFLKANYACNCGFWSVTIHKVDSDVAILACYYAPVIESCIIIKIDTGNYKRMLSVTEYSLDKNLIRSLPGLHTFSDCDSTSVFHGIGKIKELNLIEKHEIFCDLLCLLGKSVDIKETVYDVIKQMVSTAYGFENVGKIIKYPLWSVKYTSNKNY